MTAMTIQFNGDPMQLAQPVALTELLEGMQDLPENFAVAVNENFVPRSEYPRTTLSDGDQVELLVPMQGG